MNNLPEETLSKGIFNVLLNSHEHTIPPKKKKTKKKGKQKKEKKNEEKSVRLLFY